jgi:arylsulfatase A-like enzyme
VKAAREPFDKSANHELEGVLFARGPHIRKGVELEPTDVIDIAPTVLYAMGLPVQGTMDGRALTELFDPDHVAATPVEIDQIDEPADPEDGYDYSEDEIGSVQDELKSLGYL